MKPILSLFLLLALPLAAHADDTVIFAADETDLKAFDQLLESQRAGNGQEASFGQAVREEARKLQEQGKQGNAMGNWVREQKKNGSDSVSNNRSSEVRSMVSDKQAAKSDDGQGNSNKVKHGKKP